MVSNKNQPFFDLEVIFITALPFVKWVGGKRQLLHRIRNYYPFQYNLHKYAEPFVGGGAVLFDILNTFPLKEVYISDLNADLILTYKTIKDSPNDLIELLSHYQQEFLSYPLKKRGYFYADQRAKYNALTSLTTEKAALFIFLNKSCFNGLYRVNKKGEFNVALGTCNSPIICDKENILAVSSKLQSIEMTAADYQACRSFVDENTFVYLDPPYRALSTITNTVHYTITPFNDKEQIKLADFFMDLDFTRAKLLMSNSNPKNSNRYDDFFERLYDNFIIHYVDAKRSINSNPNGRGSVSELLISNYNPN